jgi:hypothetical protein
MTPTVQSLRGPAAGGGSDETMLHYMAKQLGF